MTVIKTKGSVVLNHILVCYIVDRDRHWWNLEVGDVLLCPIEYTENQVAKNSLGDPRNDRLFLF